MWGSESRGVNGWGRKLSRGPKSLGRRTRVLHAPVPQQALCALELADRLRLTVTSDTKAMLDGGKSDSSGKGGSGGKGVNRFEPYDYGKGKGKGKGKDKGKDKGMSIGKGKSKGVGKGGTAEGQVCSVHLCVAPAAASAAAPLGVESSRCDRS